MSPQLFSLLINNLGIINGYYLIFGYQYFSCHEMGTNRVANKIIPYCYWLLRTSSTLNIPALKPIYFGYIHSNLKYGIIYWGDSTNSKKLFTLEKRVIRYITKAKQWDSCKPLFNTNFYLYTWVCTICKEKRDHFIKNNL